LQDAQTAINEMNGKNYHIPACGLEL